jgi:MFS family permease
MATTAQTSSASAATTRAAVGFWAVAYAFLVVIAFNAVPAPLYGIYQRRDGFSSFAVTVIFAAYAVGVVVSLFTVGHLSDWHGRRRMVAPAVVTCMVSAGIFLAWRSLPGLIVGRVVGGVGVGAVTATATAWLSELHAVGRPRKSMRRAQLVATGANLGGIGFGPLVSGALAEWVRSPLTMPYVVLLIALGAALVLVLVSPETCRPEGTRPPYHPQRVSVPHESLARYVAAGIGAAIAFAMFGLFTSLAPGFLAGNLHHPSHALAGATVFAVFAAAVTAQATLAALSTREAITVGIVAMILGMGVLVLAVWLSTPSLALFIVGGVITGAGAGALFKGVAATVGEIAPPDRLAEALAGMFLGGYLGMTLPVIGLGVLTQYLTARTSLLIFTGALTAAVLLATPVLLGRGRTPRGD